jgi:hypothetical protein
LRWEALRLAVVAVARERSADGDDKPGAGVVDDPMIGGVPVVLGVLGAVHKGPDSVITPDTTRSSHLRPAVTGQPLGLADH